MAGATTRVTLSFKDIYGNRMQMVFWVSGTIVDPNNATVTGIVDKINAITRGAGLTIELSQEVALTGGASTSNANSATRSKLRVFGAPSTNMRRPGSWQIPGPNSGVLEADKRTFDPANVAFSGLNDAIAGVVVNKGGQPYLGVLRGYRFTQSKRSRR